MPGVFDALSAKIAARAGFEVIFITGYSVSATLLGEPDFGLLTQTEVATRPNGFVPSSIHRNRGRGYGLW
jgi:2-methylisocitrate lyase-like PEP mutase family enzyme